MEGLTELLQVALVALAFGCGVPALAYLAFMGKRRENEKFTKMKESAEKPSELTSAPVKAKHETDEDIERLAELDKPGWEKIYDQVAIKGFVYVPKPVLRRIVREILEEQKALEEAKARAEGDLEKPVKPPSGKLQVRRGDKG